MARERGEQDVRRKEVQKLIQNALASGDYASGRSTSPTPMPSVEVSKLQLPASNALNRVQNNIPEGSGAAPNHPMATPPSPVSSSGNPHRDWIIQRESEGNPRAKNPNSSAFGLGQLIEANRKAYAERFGFSPDTINPQEQLQMMDAYVKERYGSYEAARKFWEQNHWY